jgi:hypothetical protein
VSYDKRNEVSRAGRSVFSAPQTWPPAVCQNGAMDYVLHPIEPLAVRLTVARTF